MEERDHTAPTGGRDARSGLRLAGGSEVDSDESAEPRTGPAPLEDCDPLPPDRTQAILEAAKQVGAVLKAAGHPFALAGSVAAYAHGVAGGLQHDADFAILGGDAAAVSTTLREAGLRVRTPPEDWLIKARCCGQDIDLIFELSNRPVTPELLSRAPVLSVDSVRMPVLDPTDLLESMIAAFSEHHCDFGAILPIARALREKVDWDLLRHQYQDSPMPAAFFYLLERLRVIPPQEATP